MDIRCTVCQHDSLTEINLALLGGLSQKSLALRYGVSPSAMQRHHQHLKKDLAQKPPDQALFHFKENLEKLAALMAQVLVISLDAKADKDRALALRAIREAVHIISVASRLGGANQDGSPYSGLWSEEWQKLRTTIMNALEPFPESRIAVSDALTHVSR